MEGLVSFLFIAALFYLMMRMGCGKHMTHGNHTPKTDTESDENRDFFDPVCGNQVADDKGYGKLHGGHLYRFCSRACLDKFDLDPPKYVDEVKLIAKQADGHHHGT